MNRPPLDSQLQERLQRLAGQVSAPASTEADRAINYRTGVLRRRRQVRNAVGGGVLVVAFVSAVLALRGGQPSEVDTGPAGPSEGSLPGVIVDLDGWQITRSEDASDFVLPSGDIPGAEIAVAGAPDFVPGEDPASIWGGEWLLEPGPEVRPWPGGSRESIQVFRVPGQLDGPTVVVRFGAATDAVVAMEEFGEEGVSVGDSAEDDGYRNGALRQVGTSGFVLRWSPVSLGDSYAALQARGLTEDQVLEFAAGLQPRFDEAAAEDETGLEATFLPEGLEEDRVAAINVDHQDRRLVTLEGPDSSSAEIRMDSRGEVAYDVFLVVLLTTSDGRYEEVTVLDRPALLFENTDTDQWHVLWRHTDGVTAAMTLTDVDRSTVHEVINGLRR